MTRKQKLALLDEAIAAATKPSEKLKFLKQREKVARQKGKARGRGRPFVAKLKPEPDLSGPVPTPVPITPEERAAREKETEETKRRWLSDFTSVAAEVKTAVTPTPSDTLRLFQTDDEQFLNSPGATAAILDAWRPTPPAPELDQTFDSSGPTFGAHTDCFPQWRRK